MTDLNLVWYCAKTDEIFQTGCLEALFCELSIDFDHLSKECGIDLIGLL